MSSNPVLDRLPAAAVVGVDISGDMLRIAADGRRANDSVQADMGVRLPFRRVCGGFAGAFSVSAVQWLLPTDPSGTDDSKLKVLFDGLRTLLAPGAKVVMQLYLAGRRPQAVLQQAAAAVGFRSFLVCDWPHRTAARKTFLVTATAPTAFPESLTAASARTDADVWCPMCAPYAAVCRLHPALVSWVTPAHHSALVAMHVAFIHRRCRLLALAARLETDATGAHGDVSQLKRGAGVMAGKVVVSDGDAAAAKRVLKLFPTDVTRPSKPQLLQLWPAVNAAMHGGGERALEK